MNEINNAVKIVVGSQERFLVETDGEVQFLDL
jgi:hypothetical protein